MQESDIVSIEAGRANALRDQFLGWQCRIRQLAVRNHGGEPSSGMRPRAIVDSRALGPITTVLVRQRPAQATAEFRHIARKTNDPGERYQAALRYLSAAYYQHPREFSDAPTALFSLRSELVARLTNTARCVLDFEQYAERYRLFCTVRELDAAEPTFQATYWHNALYNPTLPGAVTVLAFEPDWLKTYADRERAST